jgi:acetyl esterase/lipase
MALTLDVLIPNRPNGLGVILFVSSGHRSGRDVLAQFHPMATTPCLNQGYTVFAVMHASQPKYTTQEIIEVAHRAVRFVKFNAKKYEIDPDRIGVTGASAGVHLCLMVGCTGLPGNPTATDQVEQQSSKVKAVACLFPPIDFLAPEDSCPKQIVAAFDFREFEKSSGKFVTVSPERRREIGRQLSPLTHASKGSAPTLIIHGYEDKLVPISQSEAVIKRLNACGVECKLEIRKGRARIGTWVFAELPLLVDWFNVHLLEKK